MILLSPYTEHKLSTACGTGIKSFYDPWIKIRDEFYPDHGPRIPNPYFRAISKNFFGQLFQFFHLAQIYSVPLQKLMFNNFVKLLTTKTGQRNPPPSFLLFLNLGSEAQDGKKYGSRINIPDPQHYYRFYYSTIQKNSFSYCHWTWKTLLI